jgi:hypothetical protein
MLFWLYGLIARIAFGEQLTAADRNDYRLWSGVFFLLPIALAGVWLGSDFLDRAGPLSLWCSVVLAALLFFVAWAIWARFTPTVVSFSFGVVVWIAALWMAWHGKLWF